MLCRLWKKNEWRNVNFAFFTQGARRIHLRRNGAGLLGWSGRGLPDPHCGVLVRHDRLRPGLPTGLQTSWWLQQKAYGIQRKWLVKGTKFNFRMFFFSTVWYLTPLIYPTFIWMNIFGKSNIYVQKLRVYICIKPVLLKNKSLTEHKLRHKLDNKTNILLRRTKSL